MIKLADATYLNIILLAADEPARLRRCDVYRVVDAAHRRLDHANYMEFTQRLRRDVADRPEMATEIEEVVEELGRE